MIDAMGKRFWAMESIDLGSHSLDGLVKKQGVNIQASVSLLRVCMSCSLLGANVHCHLVT